MKSIEKDKIIPIVNILTIIGIMIFFFIINNNVEMMGEDFALISFYPGNPPTSWGEYINSIIRRIIDQMANWNIRIGEQISIIFGSMNKIYFNIGNTIMSVVYICIIPVYAFGESFSLKKKKHLLAIILSFMLIIIFQPTLGEIFFWRTGSCNYLWAILILLIFAIPLRMLINNNDIIGNKKFVAFLYTIGGFFAGLTNENTVIVFISLYIGIIVYRKYSKKKIHIWVWSSFITLLLGFIVMLKAPSTAIRIQTYKDIFGIETVTVRDYVHRTQNVIGRFFNDNRYFIIILFILIILYVVLNYEQITAMIRKKEVGKFSLIIQNLAMLGGASLSVGALIGAPYVETRAFLMADFFILVTIIIIVDEILKEDKKLIQYSACFIGGIIFILCMYNCYEIYNTYKEYHNFVEQREESISSAKLEGAQSIMIQPYEFENNRILNTREDYIQSNKAYVEGYYNIEILFDIAKKYRVDSGIRLYETGGVIGGIDYKEYEQLEDRIKIYGWAAIEGKNSKTSNIDIILKSVDNTYKFPVQSSERSDVAQYYNTTMYLNTGFYLELTNIKSIVEPGIYIIDIYINDSENNKEYIKYTSESIEIY